MLAKAAKAKGVPILVDAEKPRPHLEELLWYADIVVASESFPLNFAKGEANDAGEIKVAKSMICKTILNYEKYI